MAESDRLLADRAARFGEFLEWARQHGLSQAAVAERLGLPRQFVTNVKNGDRVLTELFARRVADEFDVDHQWLLHGAGVIRRPSVSGDSSISAAFETISLPLLVDLVTGEPRRSSTWDGAMVSLIGPAMYAVVDAVHPYVHRLAMDDSQGRLQRGDLVLICQGDQDASRAGVMLLDTGSRLTLARTSSDGRWKAIETGRSVSAKARVAGRCVGIVWAQL